jgi:lysophospholipase L1-like esterase
MSRWPLGSSSLPLIFRVVLALLLLAVAALMRAGFGSSIDVDLATPAPWEPPAIAEGGARRFRATHRRLLHRMVRQRAEIIFIGDSLTAGWLTAGYAVWRSAFAGRRASNLGIPGDTTQGVLWRLENHALDGVNPRAVVLLIGTNNIPQNWAPEQIARGIVACVEAIRSKQPATNILLLGVLPRGSDRGDPSREAAEAINAILAETAFGPDVSYLDPSPLFVQIDGQLAEDLYEDGLHLSRAGYAALAQAIDSTLRRFGV